MGKRRAIDSDSSEDAFSDASMFSIASDEYTVELILKADVNDKGAALYKIRWYGYSKDQDSWEPEKNLSCDRLLRSFWKHFGVSYKRNAALKVRGMFKPSREWKDKERAYFRESMQDEKEKKRLEPKKKEKAKAKPITEQRDLQKHKELRNLFEDELNSPEDNQLDSLFTDNESDGAGTSLSTKGKGTGKAVSKEPKVIDKKTGSALQMPAVKKPVESVDPRIKPKNKFSGMKMTKTKPSEPSSSRVIPGPSNDSASVKRAQTSVSTTQRPSVGDARPSFSLADPRNTRRPSYVQQNTSISHTQSRDTSASQEPHKATDEEVNNLLATVMPFRASEAQRPGTALMGAPQNKQALAELRFEKHWSWTGDLFIDSRESAQSICEIQIKQTFEPNPTQPGLRLKTIMDSKDSLRLCKSYRRFELNMILSSVKRVDQVAGIQLKGDTNKAAFETFVNYLKKMDLVASIPAMSTAGHVGEIVVFSSSNEDLCKLFKIPLRVVNFGPLLLVLMPCHITPANYEDKYLRVDEIRCPPTLSKEFQIDNKLLGCVQSLKTPEWFLEFLAFPRQYIVWAPARGHDTPFKRGKLVLNSIDIDDEETSNVFKLMRVCKGDNVRLDSGSPRIVFLHVGAIATAHQITLLARWRERPDIRFITYGSHECIKPRYWGFNELWTLGGIVTFTANALLEGLPEVERLIQQIDKHPFWTCYVHPHALAIFIRKSCPDEEAPTMFYRRAPSCFGKIIELIQSGKIALTYSPAPLDRDPESCGKVDSEEDTAWIDDQLSQMTKTIEDHIEHLYDIYISTYSNKRDKEATEAIQQELARDMILLNTQPGIREQYRRFVIIRSQQETQRKIYEDGLEWRTLEDFSFKDDFRSDPSLDL